MQVRFADAVDIPAVVRFNERLREAGRIEEMPIDPALPGEARFRPDGFPVFRKMIIAEDGQEVRAAMLLCHHNIFIDGALHDFCWTKLPLSEGIINPRYSLAIIQLIRKSQEIHPFLMGVGGGTPDSDGYRLFAGLRWRCQEVPFFFYPADLNRVLTGLEYLRKSGSRAKLAVLVARSGLGSILNLILKMRRRVADRSSGLESQVVDSFDQWASDLFHSALPDYRVAIRSDAEALNIVYPPDDRRYIRLRVRDMSSQEDIGWIVVAVRKMEGNHYFGDLSVGTLVDGFCRTEDARRMVSAGIRHLTDTGVDLIVANFSHSAWRNACLESGMFPGPSNFNLFVSPRGGNLLEESCPLKDIHIARGHSDGMDNLI